MRLKAPQFSEPGLEVAQPDPGLALEASRQEQSPALTQSAPSQALQDQAHSQLAPRLQGHYSADEIARISYATAQVAHQEAYKGPPEGIYASPDKERLAIKYSSGITELRIADLLQQPRTNSEPQYTVQVSEAVGQKGAMGASHFAQTQADTTALAQERQVVAEQTAMAANTIPPAGMSGSTEVLTAQQKAPNDSYKSNEISESRMVNSTKRAISAMATRVADLLTPETPTPQELQRGLEVTQINRALEKAKETGDIEAMKSLDGQYQQVIADSSTLSMMSVPMGNSILRAQTNAQTGWDKQTLIPIGQAAMSSGISATPQYYGQMVNGGDIKNVVQVNQKIFNALATNFGKNLSDDFDLEHRLSGVEDLSKRVRENIDTPLGYEPISQISYGDSDNWDHIGNMRNAVNIGNQKGGLIDFVAKHYPDLNNRERLLKVLQLMSINPELQGVEYNKLRPEMRVYLPDSDTKITQDALNSYLRQNTRYQSDFAKRIYWAEQLRERALAARAAETEKGNFEIDRRIMQNAVKGLDDLEAEKVLGKFANNYSAAQQQYAIAMAKAKTPAEQAKWRGLMEQAGELHRYANHLANAYGKDRIAAVKKEVAKIDADVYDLKYTKNKDSKIQPGWISPEAAAGFDAYPKTVYLYDRRTFIPGDYAAISLPVLGLAGNISINNHTGEIYTGGAKADISSKPSFNMGWVFTNRNNEQDRGVLVNNFLEGAGANVTVPFHSVFTVGVTQAFGYDSVGKKWTGETAFELGVAPMKSPGFSVGGSAGVNIKTPWRMPTVNIYRGMSYEVKDIAPESNMWFRLERGLPNPSK